MDRLIAEIKEMAASIGCDFIPDPKKLMAFRYAQRKKLMTLEEYRRTLKVFRQGER